MEIGVSPRTLEHVTPRVERNLATGWVRSVSITIGVTEYRYFFGGKCAPAAGWFERCTLYTDSKWMGIRPDTDTARLLSTHAGIDTLTAENDLLLAKAVA